MLKLCYILPSGHQARSITVQNESNRINNKNNNLMFNN
ncbi:hypothetical protein GLIP_4063 [Aliiglaciecola lipolytica E3]|uniref:Uncharacterized protein n=1 Tax=Aliiglaciecola lipolytica E3 TaxID=1127673 RepID=K6X7S3_9ALTE|nr:hypothetical protein GLIP_4063 [Aliiglaciecola lipolytica E3]